MASTIEDMGWVIADPVDSSAHSAQPLATEVAKATMPELFTELALEYPSVVMEPYELQAVLSVVAPPVADTERACLRLVAVLDKSGSMRGEKLQLVVKTMKFMLRHLSERDALGLVAYDTGVTVLAPLTYCNAEGRRRLELALNRLSPGSQTNLSGGLIQGLELHRKGVAMSTPVQQQRVRFGNTYTRITDEEARKRHDQDSNGAPFKPEQVHEWTMELQCESESDAALVKKVVYTLHETFKNPSVEVTEAPFRITRLGWGTFLVRADIHIYDGRVLKLEHELSFSQPETFRTTLLQLRLASPPCDLVETVACGSPARETDGLVRSTFLFTDGLANVGMTEPARISEATKAILQDLVGCRSTISTFGFGADHNADLLQSLAEIGDGMYSFVESEDQIGQAFGEALGGLLTTTHQNVRLSLEIQPSICAVQTFTVYPVEGPLMRDDGTQAVDIVLGDLFAEERRDILISMKLPAVDVEGPVKIGQLSASGFSVLNTRFVKTTCVDLNIARQSGDLMTTAQRHPQVMRHHNRHLAIKAMEDARAEAQRGNLAAARRHLEAASEALTASPLTMRGDPSCLGLITDLNDCLKELPFEADHRNKSCFFQQLVSKGGAHGKQRACYGQEFSGMYANKRMHFMNSAFKEEVKNHRSETAAAVNARQTGAQNSSIAAAGEWNATAQKTALENFFQKLLEKGNGEKKSAVEKKAMEKQATEKAEKAASEEGAEKEAVENAAAEVKGSVQAVGEKNDDDVEVTEKETAQNKSAEKEAAENKAVEVKVASDAVAEKESLWKSPSDKAAAEL